MSSNIPIDMFDPRVITTRIIRVPYSRHMGENFPDAYRLEIRQGNTWVTLGNFPALFMAQAVEESYHEPEIVCKKVTQEDLN